MYVISPSQQWISTIPVNVSPIPTVGDKNLAHEISTHAFMALTRS